MNSLQLEVFDSSCNHRGSAVEQVNRETTIRNPTAEFALYTPYVANNIDLI
jgi:hypothetical protein